MHNPTIPASSVKTLAEVPLSEDMAATLYHQFHNFSENGIITVLVTEDHGLWLKTPIGMPVFLGSTTIINKK